MIAKCEYEYFINLNNKVDFVDLGLPSGTLWADRNAGAEALGGESFAYLNNEQVELFKINLPTIEQWEEIVTHCKWEWVTRKTVWHNAHKKYIGGFNVKGKGNTAIFLPAAGTIITGNICGFGTHGAYMSKTVYEKDERYWKAIYFNNGSEVKFAQFDAFGSYQIREVKK